VSFPPPPWLEFTTRSAQATGRPAFLAVGHRFRQPPDHYLSNVSSLRALVYQTPSTTWSSTLTSAFFTFLSAFLPFLKA